MISISSYFLDGNLQKFPTEISSDKYFGKKPSLSRDRVTGKYSVCANMFETVTFKCSAV